MENLSENCEKSIESGSESDDSVISISSDDNDSGKLNTSILFSSETFERIFTVTFFICSFFSYFTVHPAASTALIFVDLTHNEVVEDVDHGQPNADTAELARISQLFVKSANVTIRKRKRFDASKDSDASGSTGGNSSETGANALADNSDLDKIGESLEQTLVVEEDGKIGNTANVTIRKRNRFKVDKNSTGPYMRCLSSPIRRMLEQSIVEHTLEAHEKFLVSLNGESFSHLLSTRIENQNEIYCCLTLVILLYSSNRSDKNWAVCVS